MSYIKKWIHKLAARIRLRRIERATGVKLSACHRKIVLDSYRPHLESWGRGSGKTTVAIFWTLMWRSKPIVERDEQRAILMDRILAIPDPDVRTLLTLNNLLNMYLRYWRECVKANIKVAGIVH